MPRIKFVKSARESAKPRTCKRCGKKIKVGDSYWWFANRIGRMSMRKDYCAQHRPRPSEMTTSDKLSTLYAAQELLEDALKARHSYDWKDWSGFRDDLSQALREAASSAEQAKDGYQESFDNLPENFQNASTGSEIQEKIDACEEWESTLNDAADEIEGMEPDKLSEETETAEEDSTDAEEKEEKEEKKEVELSEDGFTQEDIEAFFDELQSKVEDASGSLSL